MNQHASRPVAQGFPSMHRRITYTPVPPAGHHRTTTQLRLSNPSSAGITDREHLRRSLFKSQIPIPIRIGHGTERRSAVVPQLSHSQSQGLLRPRRALFENLTTSQQSSGLQTMRTSTYQQSIETVFKIYEEKLQTDLGDFRAMCSRLILKEQEEKEKWHTLCLKMMKERDTALQRVSAIISERETHFSSSPSGAPGSTDEHLVSKSSKRVRDESSSVAQESTHELPYRSSPMEPRPIRSLRSSPIPSPPSSPSASLYNSSIVITSSSLPSTSSSPPPSSNAAVPSTSATQWTHCSSPLTPFNIITFNPARSPNDKTCFDVFGVIDIPETRPVKRRKSYDSSLSDKKSVHATEDGETNLQSTSSSRDEKNDSGVEPSAPRPFLIAHTDIMYIPMKGRLFCRACLLDKTTTNPSSNRRHPKTFPTNVCWDELRDHCVSEHPVACADVARLCPADLNELRRRLYN